MKTQLITIEELPSKRVKEWSTQDVESGKKGENANPSNGRCCQRVLGE